MTAKLFRIASQTLVLCSVLCPRLRAQEISSLPLFPRDIAAYSLHAGPADRSPRTDSELPQRPELFLANTNEPAPSPIHISSRRTESAPYVIRRPFRAWLILTIAGQATVLADVKTTLDLRHSHPLTFHEGDPLARPFVNLPVPAYVASSVGFTAALSLFAWKLNRSENTWVRHHWWLPQTTQTVLNADCAVHNVRE